MTSSLTSGSRWQRFRTLDLRVVAALLICVVVAAVLGVVVMRARARAERQNLLYFASDAIYELEPVKRTYGPNKYSRSAEESIIRDFFRDRRDGVFVDIGANHYRDDSNTYFLEKERGWSGVAVDAIGEFAADYKTYRPQTRFFAAFVSDVGGSTEQLYVPEGDGHRVASSNAEFTKTAAGTSGVARTVPTVTLNDLLSREGITRIDLMSMDIELAEPKALAGFDLRKFRPELVCIEGHFEVRQQLLDYFARHGYVLVGKYLRADPDNLYFTPLVTP